MEKHGYSLCQRVLAMLLCAVMLVPSILTPAFATEATEPAAVVETTAPAQEWTLPECDCGNTETELGKHGETCARKAFLEEFCKETAADIFAKWEKLPEESQKYILEYLSKDETDAEKLAELKGFIDAAQKEPEQAEETTGETGTSAEETEASAEETEASSIETEESNALALYSTRETGDEEPLAVVWAASDLQGIGNNILWVTRDLGKLVTATGCLKVDGALFVGDYDYYDNKNKELAYDISSAGAQAILDVLSAKWKDLTADTVVFGSGNHDYAGFALKDPTGGYDKFAHYAVYNINYEDYSYTLDSETVAETANALDTWLDVKAEQGYSKPIFVMSHVPLHLNGRKENKTSYDSRNAGYIVDVLNEAGKNGLNIIYLFGHNHSNGYDGYIGGSCIFYAPGETMLVYNIGGTADSDFKETKLHFTYMNAGYVGYTNTGEPGETLSSSIFEIYEDCVVISRYSQSEKVNLKNQGVRSTNYKDNTVIYDAKDEEGNYLWAVDESVRERPYTLYLQTPAGGGTGDGETGNEGTGGGTGDGEGSAVTIRVYQEWNLFNQQTGRDDILAAVYRDTMSGVIEKDGNTYQRHTPGVGQVLTLDASGNLITQDTVVVELTIGEKTNRYMLPEDNQLWVSEFATENGEKDWYYLKNQADPTQYLAIRSEPDVQEGTSGNAKWRMSSVDYNLFEKSDKTIIPNGSGGWTTFNRHNNERTHVYYPAELKVFVQLDQSTASVEAGTAGTPNLGNVEVYIKEYSETEPVWEFPITIDMLGLDAASLMIPGEYAVENFKWRGIDLGDYTLTVSGGGDRFIPVPDTDDSLFASLSGNQGSVPVGTGNTISTGNTLTLYTVAADGTITIEEIPVTVDMLNVTAEEMKTAGTYRKLNITYKGAVIPEVYTLTVYVKPEDYPEFPDAGAVKIDKWVDTNTYDYYGTGTAQINLSVTGTTTYRKSNAVFIVDASSSMRQCIHGVNSYKDKDYIRDYTADELALIVDFMMTKITRELSSAEKSMMVEIRYRPENELAKGSEEWTRLLKACDTRKDAGEVYDGYAEDLLSVLRLCGYCTESKTWIGTAEAEEKCPSREVVLEEALIEMLKDFANPDENGQIPDVDIAISYFNSYTPINKNYKMKGQQTEWTDKKINHNPKPITEGFVNSQDIDEALLNTIAGEYKTASGTNFDDALQQAYDLLAAKQKQDHQNYLENGDTSIPYEPRRDFVVFMSDGEPYQYNYFGGYYQDTKVWPQWYSGTIDEAVKAGGAYTDYVEARYLNKFHEYYHPDGKHWIAEAIKGDKDTLYPIINPVKGSDHGKTIDVKGLDATIMSIGVCLGEENEETKNAHDVMRRIASNDSYYIKCETADEIKSAFGTYATLIRSTHNAVFYDQMGAEFDLQMVSSMTTGADQTVTLNPAPTIQVKKYETWKRKGEGVTEDMIGTRKPQDPKILETITFKADGTEAYSDMVDVNGDGVCDTNDNILIDDVICAANFWYNTSHTEVKVIEVDRTKVKLEPETFYWNIGNVNEDELVLSYYVYLTGSMEGQRDEEERNYDTNEYAKLTYINHLNHSCEQSVPTPVLPWKNAVVGYAFYLVNRDGKPIINQTTGETGSFEQAIKITNPVYETFALNQAEQDIIASIIAHDKLPDGYTLFDEGAQYDVQANSGGSGYYHITVTKTDKSGNPIKTTYVVGIESTPINGTVNEIVTTDGGKTTNSVVWFGVVADVKAVPDTVVIDFGLPVEINVLENDTMLGANGELEYIGSTSCFADGYAAAKNKEADLTLWKYLQNYDVNTTPEFTTKLIHDENGELKFGDADIHNANVRYCIDTMAMNAEDTFVYAVNYTGSIGEPGYYYSTVTVIPATTIYYEDSFVKFSTWNVSDDKPNMDPANQWQTEGTTADKTQAEDRPGSFSLPAVDADNIYGYDGAYTDMTTYSLGSAMKFTANKQVYGEAQFTFWGTGFDLVSLTSNTTGTVTVDVYETDAFEQDSYWADSKTYMVDTYYGYKYVLCDVVYEWDVTPLHRDGYWVRISATEAAADATEQSVKFDSIAQPKEGDRLRGVEKAWIVDKYANDALYQVPVMKVTGLEYKQYTVIVTVYYRTGMDHQNQDGKNEFDFYLDAIRIYDPANDGKDNPVIEDAYVADGEGWPEYFELRNLIIKKKDFDSMKDGTGEGIVFIDNTLDDKNNVIYSIEDYTNFGPNNELYLAPGQSIAFDLNVTGKVAGIHLAMKTVGGSDKEAKAQVFAADKRTNLIKEPIKTATDLYYDITTLNGKTVVISNSTDSTAILSITNVKVTYQSEHTDDIENSLFRVSVDMAEAAIYSLRRMSAPDPEDEIPETTVPVPSEPEVTEPEATEPEVTEPSQSTVPSEPEVTEPSQSTEPTEPEVSEPSQSAELPEPGVEMDTGDLEKAITKAKSLKKADYTTKSWKAMQDALKVAEKVMADKNATQNEIDDAADALNNAIKALAPTAGQNSETGDNTLVVMLAVIGAMALAGIAVLLAAKKKSRR